MTAGFDRTAGASRLHVGGRKGGENVSATALMKAIRALSELFRFLTGKTLSCSVHGKAGSSLPRSGLSRVNGMFWIEQ